jgi:hypothetical protein
MTDSLLGQTSYPDKDFHSELVGEGKKFKDDKELAKGKYYADELLKTYETQMDQMREDIIKLRDENAAKAKMEDLIDRYQNLRQAPLEQYTQTQDKSPSIDIKQIESLVDSRVEQREAAKTATNNLSFVKNKLVEQYGKDYSVALERHMADLGITEQFLNDTARNNPKAALRMLGIDPDPVVKDPFRMPPKSNMVPATFKPTEEKRTWNWYQNMKATDPKKYYSAATNVQMHKDALALGSEFEDGDFNRFEKDYRITF